MPRLRFDDLTLFSAAFEVRYDDALLIWDRSGVLWRELHKVIPNLQRKHAEPNRVVFGTTGNAELDLSVELGRLGVVASNPETTLREFAGIAAVLTEHAVASLDIISFSRVGLRVMYKKTYPSHAEAAQACLSVGLLSVDADRSLEIEAPITAPESSFRKEDGKNGIGVRFKAESVKFEVQPAFGWSGVVEKISHIEHRVNLDVDSFMMAPVSAESLIITDWILQSFHVIKRYALEIMNAGRT